MRKSERSWFKAHLSPDIFNMGIVMVQYSKIEKTRGSLTCFVMSLHYIYTTSMHIYCSVRLGAGDWCVTLPCRSTTGFNIADNCVLFGHVTLHPLRINRA